MTRIVLSVLTVMMWCAIAAAQTVFITNTGKVTFYSKAPLEDIEATTTKANCILNTANGEVVSIIAIRSFKFEKALMEEHFNEKYLESDKYKDATFKGKTTETLITDKDTSYKVNVTGTMKIHGVEQPVAYLADYSVKSGNPSLEGSFNIALKDYNITIPKLVIENIAEVVKVTCKFDLEPYKKKN